MNLSFFLSLAACRTRSSACVTRARICARCVLCCPAFPSAPALRSTDSAAGSRLCSPASSLLWRGLTSRARASSASAPRLPDADRDALPPWPGTRSPGSRAKSVRACQGLRPRQAGLPLAIARPFVLPSTSVQCRHLGRCDFRGSMAGLRAPLPTLHLRPRGQRRTARGRRGFATPSSYRTFTTYSLAGLPAHIAVGTRVTPRPPHRSGQAQLRHPAPTSGAWRRSAQQARDEGFSVSGGSPRPASPSWSREYHPSGSAAGAFAARAG